MKLRQLQVGKRRNPFSIIAESVANARKKGRTEKQLRMTEMDVYIVYWTNCMRIYQENVKTSCKAPEKSTDGAKSGREIYAIFRIVAHLSR